MILNSKVVTSKDFIFLSYEHGINALKDKVKLRSLNTFESKLALYILDTLKKEPQTVPAKRALFFGKQCKHFVDDIIET